jgi:hypothetical protein
VKASWVMGGLLEPSVSTDKVRQLLEDEGADKFSKSFDKLMATLEEAVQE